MTTTTSSPSLAEEILTGHNRSLKELAAQGVLPLPREELIRIQVALILQGDEAISGLARESLAALDRTFLLNYLRHDAGAEALSHFAHSDEPWVVEAVLQRKEVPFETLLDLAPRVSADLQEILLLRQDVIIERPQLLDALEANPELSRFSRRKVDEYRHHLLGQEKSFERARGLAEALEGLDDDEKEEVAAAVEQVIGEVEPEGELDTGTGLSESQVRALPSSIRAKLARGASRTLRAILIRDPNPQVATMVLRVSSVTESEIEQVSANRYVCDEVLAAIASRREWVVKYNVIQNLVRNPRTPVGVAVKFVSRLSVRDLGLLRKDRNVPDAVRQTALRLHKLKTQ